jgi:hypothetical protein
MLVLSYLYACSFSHIYLSNSSLQLHEVIDTLTSSGLTPAAVEKIARMGNDNICTNSIAQSEGCSKTVVEAALFKPRRGRSSYFIFAADLRSTDEAIQQLPMAQVCRLHCGIVAHEILWI